MGNNDFEKYFKPGDKVRCIKPEWQERYPGIGEIVEISDVSDAWYPFHIGVKFTKEKPLHSWPEDSLELVK